MTNFCVIWNIHTELHSEKTWGWTHKIPLWDSPIYFFAKVSNWRIIYSWWNIYKL